MKSDLLDSTVNDKVLEWDSAPEKPLSLSKVVAVFAELSKFHRPPHKEAAVREWIIASAEEQNCLYRSDEAGNLVVYIPASPQASATAKTLILQSHLDMVCVSDGDYDWSQGVKLQVEDGWLTACSTSLGADNGAGVAMMVQLLRAHKELVHPPLELLFTIAEEIGLKGALALDPQLLQGSSLLNIDSSDSGSLVDGGAGSKSYLLQHKIKRYKNEEQGWRLLVGGLAGGHSGGRISYYENNAILLVYRCYLLLKKEFGDSLTLSDLKGGEGDNIIPNHAQLDFTFSLTKKNQAELGEILQQKLALLLDEERLLYPKLTWKLQTEHCATVLDKESVELLKMLPLLPNGACLYNHPRQVAELSANLAVLELAEEQLSIRVSTRFARSGQVDFLEDNIESVAELFECQLSSNQKFYPSWTTVKESPLRDFALACYRKLFNEEAKLCALHGGLEPGVILDRLLPRKVDALSFGPTKEGLHTTAERLSLKGYEKSLQLFHLILEELASV